jgi:hypothetical protein
MYELDCFEKALSHFGTRVDVIIAMEMGDKIGSDEAYKMIKEELKKVLDGEVAPHPEYSLDLYKKLGETFNEKTVYVPISFNSAASLKMFL